MQGLTCLAKGCEPHAQQGGPPITQNVLVLNTIAFRSPHCLMQDDPQLEIWWQEDEEQMA